MESVILTWIIKNPIKTVLLTIITVLTTCLIVQTMRLSYTKNELVEERGNNAIATSLIHKQNQTIKQLHEDSKKALATIKEHELKAKAIRQETNRRVNELLNSGRELKTCEEAMQWLSQQRP